jgi:hypothetical protein
LLNLALLLLNLEHNDAIDGGPEEDTNIISVPQPATAAVISQELVIAIDGQSATLARNPSTIPAPDEPEMPEQAVEVVNDKQEWEICDIIGKEDVDGVPHYWVQWSATLVPKYEMGKARALVARFEARHGAQRKQKGGKGRGRLLPSKAGKQASAGVLSLWSSSSQLATCLRVAGFEDFAGPLRSCLQGYWHGSQTLCHR